MKKTIITLLALAGVTSAAPLTLTFAGTGSSSNDQNYGFTLKLTDTFLTASDTVGTTFDLASVTLQSANDAGSFDRNSRLAIFEFVGDYKVGNFVAISDNTSNWTANSDLVMDFSSQSITLDTSKQYMFLYTNADATADLFSTTSGDNLAAWQAVSVKNRILIGGTGANLPSGDGVYWNNNIGDWAGHNMAFVTVTAKDAVIPEPTTATLSLLALAGLAARRRRK